MTVVNSSNIEEKLSKIINSIPIKFTEQLSSKNKKLLISFSEMTGITLESTDIFRNLAALLILNRIRFIALFGEGPLEKDSIYATYKTISDLLKQSFPQMFIPSILDSIANLSTLIVSKSFFNFNQEFLNQSTDIISSLYLKVLNQKDRRKMGQFWTPKNIAEFLIKLSLENKPRNILDPCTGPGTFINTLRENSLNFNGKITAIELHPLVYEISKVNLYDSPYETELIYGNFLTCKTNMFYNSIHDSLAFSSSKGLELHFQVKSNGFDCIICNPPYSRHHVIPSEIKSEIGKEIEDCFGGKFNRISSLFMYFILKSLKLLIKNGRLVFITPTIIFESRNSIYLKKILKDQFRIPFIIVFHHSLNVFPNVDTAACIFTIEGKKPEPTDVTKLLIVKKWSSTDQILNYLKIESNEIFKWKDGELHNKKQNSLDPESNWVNPEAFSNIEKNDKLIELSSFFKVMRGIATGNNKFFTFNDDELLKHSLKSEYIIPTITKTRYIQKYIFGKDDFDQLRNENRKVWLLYIQEEKESIKDQKLLDYIELGESKNVQDGSLVKTRKYWYTSEQRDIPYLIYTYLSRGSPRFILNEAQVRPLNTFLMLYPREKKELTVEILLLLWVILNSNITVLSLRNVGRCYGGDTLKIEPKEMMKASIINPLKISNESKIKLFKLAKELKKIDTSKSTNLFKKIDGVLEEELNN